MSTNLLEVKNIRTYFEVDEGEIKAVDDISFQLKQGETLGIVGESGSGKSVTALTIMRLLAETAQIESGEISFFGRDLVKLPIPELRNIRGKEISMIFQEPMTSLNPVFTVGSQIMEAILTHQNVSKSEAKDRTISLFREVGIPDPEERIYSYPHEMSGGQRQRVMISMALSCNPKLLIADEPTTALDVTIQSQILDLLRSLRDNRDMSILFISHDLGVIAEIADYVAVMYRGKIVEYNSLLEIFSNPKHPYTKGLLACRPKLDSEFSRLPTVDDFMEVKEINGNIEIFDKSPEDISSLSKTIEKNVKLIHPRSVISDMGYPVNDFERDSRNRFVENNEKPLLSVKDLKVYFPIKKGLLMKTVGYIKAVDGINFDIYRGQTLGLVGESGCGKTTTGRSILNLISPTSGSICFDGIDLLSIDSDNMRNLRKRMQIIFQDPYGSMNPRMNIETILTEPLTIHGIGSSKRERRDIVVSLLEEVGLQSEYLRRYPHEFSGGQRQRICIARALTVNPDFIICDESVSALDVSVQAQVLNLLKDLQEKHSLTYIFISHDLNVVKFMSDMIAVMNEGKIVEFGPSEYIYKNPSNTYTKRLIESTPKDDIEHIKKRVYARNITN
ncbi:MAG: ABC transporter ATP-binding protein [Thermodesulfobacteriota bacterium]